MSRPRRVWAWLTLAAALLWVASCGGGVRLGLLTSPTGTATSTPISTPASTATFIPTATATPTLTATATATPTPTFQPLRLSVSLHPPEVAQGHTLWVQVQSNRSISVTGSLDGRSLSFAPVSGGAWALAGVPVEAEPGAHSIDVSIEDGFGASVSVSVPVVFKTQQFGYEQIDIPADRQGLLAPNVVLAETELLSAVFAEASPEKLWEGLFAWPHVGEITSSFGMSRTYNGVQSGFHGGVDITGELGAPVFAANAGRVALAAQLQVRGNAVILDHGCGLFSAYYHLSEILVQEGQEVTQGELIGRLGNTGLSTGAHLHWEIRVGDVLVDPVEWTSNLMPDWP